MSLSLRSIGKRAISAFLLCCILQTAGVLAQAALGSAYTGQLSTTIKPVSPAEPPACRPTEFYDITAFVCRECPTDAVGYISPGAKGLGATTALSCRCKPGFVLPPPDLTRGVGATPPVCTACPQGTAPNAQGSACATCNTTSTSNPPTIGMKVGTKTATAAGNGLPEGQCGCSEGDVFQQAYKWWDSESKTKYSLSCKTCKAGQFPGPGWECKKCADFREEYVKAPDGAGTGWTCGCRAGYTRAGGAGSGCVTQADYDAVVADIPGQQLIRARSVVFRDVISSDGSAAVSTSTPTTTSAPVESDLFSRYLVEGAVGCRFNGQPKMCQLLANLCVLTMYDPGSGACTLFDGLVSELPKKASEQYPDESWRQGLPWLTYSQDVKSLLQTSLKSQGFDLTVGFYDDAAAGRSQYLTFVLARYALDGTFLGFQQLASQMSACPMTYNDVLNMQRFGAMTENFCEFDLDSLMQGAGGQPEAANVLFELFLKDDKGNMIDVPVLIKNYRLAGGAEGAAQTPNMAAPTPGEIGNSAWQLVRRFFIFDSVSGIDEPGGYAAQQKPRYVRWANDVRIKVTMDPTQPEALYRPYVILDYRAGDGNSIDSTTRSRASFVMEYYSDYGPIMTQCLIAFICLFVLVILVWAGRMRNFSHRNPREILGQEYVSAYAFKAGLYFFETWSQIMFWLLFWSCASVFIAFKLQVNAVLLLPELGAASDWVYSAFYGVLGATLACRALAVLMRIYEQAKIDIYVVDFERPNFDTRQVNAWRHVFITNEFSELQANTRYVSPETTFIWFCFFWVGLGWQNLSQADPSFSVEDNPVQASNAILKFFVVALLFLCIGAVQFVYHNLEAFVSGSAINQFVDLCTLANISLVLLEEHLYGYYLHAQAPWGASDIPLDWLQSALQAEATAPQATSRGLIGNQRASREDRVQTFQIYLPASLKRDLARIRASSAPVTEQAPSRSAKSGADAQGRRRKGVDEDGEEGAPLNAGKRNRGNAPAAPDHLLSGRERAIKEDEHHKRQLNQLLKNKLAENITQDQIKVDTWWSRLVGTLPTLSETDRRPIPLATMEKLVVVEDNVEQYPSFQNVLYCSLDGSLVLLYIMFFYFFDMLFAGNGLLSVFAVWVVERALRALRAELGEKNLCEKAHVDERFLI